MYADPQPARKAAESRYVEVAVEIFAMLADATRLRIVLALRDGELSVNDLADVVDRSPSGVSQHLAKLRLARIVSARHDGARVFYRLDNEHARRLVTDAVFHSEHVLDVASAHHARPGELTAGGQ